MWRPEAGKDSDRRELLLMKERIESAVKLILKNSGDGWFMIFEEPKSEKFVQFAFDEGSGLIFDLPYQALTGLEKDSARVLLAGMGVAPQTEDVFGGPEGDHIGQQCSFQAEIGFDAEMAVSLTYRVMREVYGFRDETKIDVTINR